MIHKIFLTISLLCICALNAYAVDLDNDGLDDIFLVTAADDDTLSWSYLSSATGYTTVVSLGSYGTSDDRPLPGSWTAAGMSELTYLDAISGGDVVWYNTDASSNESTVTFGKRKNTFLNGDFNGDGIADGVRIARAVEIFVNLFASDSALVQMSFTRGQVKGAIPFVLIDTANGNSESVALLKAKRSRGSRKTYTLRWGDVSGNTFSSSFREKGSIANAFAIQPGMFGYQRGKKLIIRDVATGTKITDFAFSKNTQFIVGDFNASDSGDEIAGYAPNSGRLTIVNPITGTASEVTGLTESGTVYDDYNVASFVSRGSNSGGVTGGNLSSLCSGGIRNARDGANGNVYKLSDHGGLPVFVTHDGAQSGSAISTSGDQLDRLRYTGLGNRDPQGLRHHYRFNVRCSSLPNLFYIRLGNRCYEINDRCGRVD